MHEIDKTFLKVQAQVQPDTLNILCIAASTSLCSLALKTTTGVLRWDSTQTNQHSEQLLPAATDLIARAGLKKPDLIAVDIGPGAFTSVRVACGVAQGLALGWNCHVLPVQSLTALAHQVIAIHPQHKTIICVIDARMNECYVAQYAVQSEVQTIVQDEKSNPSLIQTHAPELVPYAQVTGLGAGCVIGNAAPVLVQWSTLASTVMDATPSAQGVLDAALAALHAGEASVLPDYLQPLYIRNHVAQTTAERTAERSAATLLAQSNHW